jgi:hypothetical protein
VQTLNSVFFWWRAFNSQLAGNKNFFVQERQSQSGQQNDFLQYPPFGHRLQKEPMSHILTTDILPFHNMKIAACLFVTNKKSEPV